MWEVKIEPCVKKLWLYGELFPREWARIGAN